MSITYIKYLYLTNYSINQNAISRSSFIKPKLLLYVFTLQLLHVNSLHFNISIKKAHYSVWQIIIIVKCSFVIMIFNVD